MESLSNVGDRYQPAISRHQEGDRGGKGEGGGEGGGEGEGGGGGEGGGEGRGRGGEGEGKGGGGGEGGSGGRFWNSKSPQDAALGLGGGQVLSSGEYHDVGSGASPGFHTPQVGIYIHDKYSDT